MLRKGKSRQYVLVVLYYENEPNLILVVMWLIFFCLAVAEMPFKQHDGLDEKIEVDFLCVFHEMIFSLHQICFSFLLLSSYLTIGVIIIISASSLQ